MCVRTYTFFFDKYYLLHEKNELTELKKQNYSWQLKCEMQSQLTGKKGLNIEQKSEDKADVCVQTEPLQWKTCNKDNQVKYKNTLYQLHEYLLRLEKKALQIVQDWGSGANSKSQWKISECTRDKCVLSSTKEQEEMEADEESNRASWSHSQGLEHCTQLCKQICDHVDDWLVTYVAENQCVNCLTQKAKPSLFYHVVFLSVFVMVCLLLLKYGVSHKLKRCQSCIYLFKYFFCLYFYLFCSIFSGSNKNFSRSSFKSKPEKY
ncbi:hypothetical protein RFI_26987 [Reticulomyxa filosa]|uniref:Uncharacterized protein n=1 Tax=Reticulomyxa filosa TaxID=46433 RepID=X6M949_RETFI|nr:hypothetical protein RFI_26987 [Reticulomyxa filosa]|eukprot:ETO10389.1 hypothetical protein RFI_26987 [Reticulomyxa filosa]